MVSILEKEDFKRSVLKRLVYSVGKDTDYAVPRDWCVAVTLAVRERLMDRWLASTMRVYKEDVKRVYYLSMEFLIGRLLEDAMVNTGVLDDAKAVFDEAAKDDPKRRFTVGIVDDVTNTSLPIDAKFDSESERYDYNQRIMQRIGVDANEYSVLNINKIGIDMALNVVN